MATSMRRAHGVSRSEFLILLSLSEAQGGALRVQSIADMVGLDQSSVSRLLSRLADQDWLERCVYLDDKRAKYGLITDRGRMKVDEGLPTFREMLATALDDAAGDVITAPVVGRLRRR